MARRNLFPWTLLLGLAVAALPACTMPATAELEWTVANNTDDSLRVRVRYPLDSTLLAADQLAGTRRAMGQDSVLQYWLRPLDHLARHEGQWYAVTCQVMLLNAYVDHFVGERHYARIDRAHGLLSYALPPHSSQRLLTEGYADSDRLPDPDNFMTGLWLQQGLTDQPVLPGHPWADVFHAARTGREGDNNSLHRRQLTVGPGLRLNPRWYHTVADAWSKLFPPPVNSVKDADEPPVPARVR